MLIIIHGDEKTWPVVGSYFRHKMILRHPNTNIHLERYRNRRRTSDRYVIVKRRECWNLTGVQISLPFPAYISKTCAFYCLSIFVKKKSSTKSEWYIFAMQLNWTNYCDEWVEKEHNFCWWFTGAESVVYEGTLDGQKVAVKKPILSVSEDINKFHKELQLLWSVSHSPSHPHQTLFVYYIALYMFFCTLSNEI